MPRRKKMFNVDIGPTEWEEKIKRYFDETPPKEWTFGGLYLYIGVGDRKFNKIGKQGGYTDGYDYARAKMSMQYEQRMNTNNSTGAIFGLKNLGWSDKTDMNLAVEGKVKVEDLLKGGKLRAK